MLKGKVVWVVVPFMTREFAENVLCEVEEMGYHGAVVTPSKAMVKQYSNSPDLRNEERSA
jgi:hypothetical protein